MDGGAQYNPRTVEDVFRDFKGRRTGMIKALTTGSFFSLFLFFFLISLNFERSELLGFFRGFSYFVTC